MSEHGFERVDKVLAHLAEELDASLKKRLGEQAHHSGDFGTAPPSDPECVVDGTKWVRNHSLTDLFDTMNTRFEGMAKRLRISHH